MARRHCRVTVRCNCLLDEAATRQIEDILN